MIDLGVALHCARVTLTAYQICPPTWLTDHLQALEAMSVRGPDSEVVQRESNHDVIDTDQAAAIIGCSARHIRRIATNLTGQRIAGRWLFDKHAVTEYAAAKAQGGCDSDH